MSWAAVAAAGASAVGGYLASRQQGKAAGKAAGAATHQAELSDATQRYFFDETQKAHQPYQLAGLLGLQGLTGKWGGTITDPTHPYESVAKGISYLRGQELMGKPGAMHYSGVRIPTTEGPRKSGHGFYQQKYGAPQQQFSIPTGEQPLGFIDGTAPTAPPAPIDAPGIAGGFLSQLQNLDRGRSERIMDQYGIDRSTPSRQYMARMDALSGDLPSLSLPEFKYTFDEQDPAYQFRRQQMEKTLNEAAAARGQFNSRAALNALQEGSMALTADEVDRQFGRQKDIYNLGLLGATTQHGADYQRASDLYGRDYDKLQNLFGMSTQREAMDRSRLMDLYGMAAQREATDASRVMDMYNIANQQKMQDYGKLLDLVKIGQGAAGSTGGAAMATGQGLASNYANLSAALQGAAYQKGQANADFLSGLGAMPMNYMMMSKMMGGGG